MSARFQVTERDYVRAFMSLTELSPRKLGLLLLLTLMLAIAMLFLPGGDWRRGAGALVMLGAVAWAIFFAAPSSYRRHYHRYKVIFQDQTVTLMDDGVRFDVPNGSRFVLTWDLISSWRCNMDYVMICSPINNYHVIPATVAAQGFDLERLKSTLTQHVGPAKQ